MRWREVVALGILVAASDLAAALDAPPTKPAAAPTAEQRALADKLRTRVTEWCNARKQLSQAVCDTCRGWGQVQEKMGRIVTCPTCDGRKVAIRRAAFRKVAYEMKSPAWRSQDRARELAGEAYDAANRSSTASGFLRSFRIDRVELVGAEHGIAWVFEGTDTVARESRWVLSIEPSTKTAAWFIYDASVDGPWPPDAPPPSAEETPPEPLPQLLDILVQSAMKGFSGAHTPDSRARVGRRLVLRLRHAGPPDARVLRAEVRDDAIALFRMLFERMKSDWDAIQLEFTALWQDRFGAREWRPVWVVSLDADTYRRIHFQNLDADATFALFDAAPKSHDGWKLLEPTK